MKRFIVLILWGILLSDFAGFAQAPTVTTQAVTDIDATAATGNGNITDLGVPNPSQHGICWNTKGEPTIANFKTEEGSASTIGSFTSDMTGLSPNSIYYVRAYATNSVGTVYGEDTSFCTPPEVIAPLLQVFFIKSIQFNI